MFDKLPITKIELLPGRTVHGSPQDLQLSALTVFVGPNNSGKSLMLREIFRHLTQPRDYRPRQLTGEFELTPLSEEEADYVRSKFEREPPPNAHRQSQTFYCLYKGGVESLGEQQFLKAMREPTTQPHIFRQFYLNNFTTNLGGETRINLTNPQPMGNLQAPDPFQSLQVLFAKDELREEVRSILHRAFEQYFVIDPSNNGQLSISFSPRAPVSVMEEQGLHKEARAFYAAAQPIAEASDGVKAYTGIITQIVAGDPAVILIDEPEAFLHPPLAQQLGKEIAQVSEEAQKNVFVATHSSNFVMGCIQSGGAVDVVRLTYRDGNATARILQSEELMALTRHPLLRSTGVLNALFYEAVVVTESDSDRAFYQEVNERLLRCSKSKGIPNCLFLNAQNKQTTRLITKPLRALGIPALSIVDIDVLKEGGAVWSDFLMSGYVPELDRKSFATARAVCCSALEKTGKNMKTEGGIALLDDGGRESVGNLFDRLEDYGLFVVRGGEAECWLKHLGAKGHGSNWLVDIFEKMGDDPSQPHYVMPASNDVWVFIERARTWLLNVKRKGIPA